VSTVLHDLVKKIVVNLILIFIVNLYVDDNNNSNLYDVDYCLVMNV